MRTGTKVGQTKKYHPAFWRQNITKNRVCRREGSRETLGTLPVPKTGPKKAGEGIWTSAWQDRRDGFHLPQGRVRLEIRKEFLPMSGVRPWLWLYRKTVHICFKHFQKRGGKQQIVGFDRKKLTLFSPFSATKEKEGWASTYCEEDRGQHRAAPISVAAIKKMQEESVYQNHLIIHSACALSLMFLANLVDIQRAGEEL